MREARDRVEAKRKRGYLKRLRLQKKFILLENTGHSMFIDNPELFGNTIRDILENHEKRENINIREILSYVEAPLEEDLSLDDLAEKFHYSKFYISRAFTQEYGKSYYQYLKDRRLTVAAQALVETSKPIIEIAYDAHYNSLHSCFFWKHRIRIRIYHYI